MSDDQGSYARIYITVRDDAKFVDVYPDDHHWATYTRLLMIAEDAWPASGHLPYGVNRRSLDRLANNGVIEVRGGMFKVVGLDAERARRARESRNGGTVRAEGAVRDENGRFLPAGSPPLAPVLDATAGPSPVHQRVQPAKPSLDEPSLDEQDGARGAGPAQETTDPADAYWSLTGRYPVGKPLDWIDELIAKFGAEAVTRHLVAAYSEDPKTSTILGRTQNRLRAENRALDRKEAEDEKARLREKRAIPKELPAWEAEYRAAIEARYAT